MTIQNRKGLGHAPQARGEQTHDAGSGGNIALKTASKKEKMRKF